MYPASELEAPMPTVESSGVRLHVQELGHGDKTVVLVHQLLGNMASWYF